MMLAEEMTPMNSRSKIPSITLFRALSGSLAFSSMIVFVAGFFGLQPFLAKYVRSLVHGHQSTIESFFRDSISQQILLGDGPEVLRKCHMLLQEDYVRAVFIKDLNGEVICDLKKSSGPYSIRWVKSPIHFDEDSQNLATEVVLGFSTQAEERLVWITMVALLVTIVLLFLLQILLNIPLTRRVLSPLALLSRSVAGKSPENIALPDIQVNRPLVREVQDIFISIQAFLDQFKIYRKQLIESIRYETVARTVQIIAHDLKAPMAAFERMTRIPEGQFAQERKYLVQALNQLYSMVDAIKRAEFEDIVRLQHGALQLSSLLDQCKAMAEVRGIQFVFEGASNLESLSIDESKLNRALSNLIANGIEAAQNLVIFRVLKHADELRFEIEDDGPGIPPAFQNQLFARGATYGKSDGTGLGLYYVKRIAQGHGGDVFYKRVVERTRFIMVLPCLSEEMPSVETESFESAFKDLEEQSAASPDRDFLIVVSNPQQAQVLKESPALAEADIVMSFAIVLPLQHSYRFILVDDWQIAGQLKALDQKILIDSQDADGFLNTYLRLRERLDRKT
jgi:signal transduction histidine kinase